MSHAINNHLENLECPNTAFASPSHPRHHFHQPINSSTPTTYATLRSSPHKRRNSALGDGPDLFPPIPRLLRLRNRRPNNPAASIRNRRTTPNANPFRRTAPISFFVDFVLHPGPIAVRPRRILGVPGSIRHSRSFDPIPKKARSFAWTLTSHSTYRISDSLRDPSGFLVPFHGDHELPNWPPNPLLVPTTSATEDWSRSSALRRFSFNHSSASQLVVLRRGYHVRFCRGSPCPMRRIVPNSLAQHGRRRHLLLQVRRAGKQSIGDRYGCLLVDL